MRRELVMRVTCGTVAVSMTAVCIYLLVSTGSSQGMIAAVGCGVFPVVAWLEASKLRARGAVDAEQAVLHCMVYAVSMFLFLALYAAG